MVLAAFHPLLLCKSRCSSGVEQFTRNELTLWLKIQKPHIFKGFYVFWEFSLAKYSSKRPPLLREN